MYADPDFTFSSIFGRNTAIWKNPLLMILTPPEKCKFKQFAHLLYLTYHFMQTSIMKQLQMLLCLLKLECRLEIITVRILLARQ